MGLEMSTESKNGYKFNRAFLFSVMGILPSVVYTHNPRASRTSRHWSICFFIESIPYLISNTMATDEDLIDYNEEEEATEIVAEKESKKYVGFL